jgi:hypothetical protein
MPAMGCKISLLFLWNQPSIASVNLVTALCHHAARIGWAARRGMQFILAMIVFI